MNDIKPLFIPLLRVWFELFQSGEKTEEWRRYGGCWNERTCWLDRPVTLSLGYTRMRLSGRITGFRRAMATGPAIGIYGAGTECAVFGIAIDR
jgi:hypothetical protein